MTYQVLLRKTKPMSGSERARLIELRELAYLAQGGLCHWCEIVMTIGEEPPLPTTCTADHLVPRSEGGRTTPDNIVAACMRCNTHRQSTEAVETHNKLQVLGLVNPQKPRNQVLAHALKAALGDEAIREILRLARAA